jgi:hypothetical protein
MTALAILPKQRAFCNEGRSSYTLRLLWKHQTYRTVMMKQIFVTLALLVALSPLALAQTGTSSASTQDQPTPPVKITHQPVVEFITDSTAQIAWSTNVNAGTLVHYGTDPQNLNQSASMPWGGLTHRVVLRHLTPDTTYYFKAESAQGQDTGTRAEAPQLSFKTVAEGERPIRNKQPQ